MKKNILAVLFLTFAFSLIHGTSNAGEKDQFKNITVKLVEQANHLCNSIIPIWIKSKSGMRDQSVRRLVTDCYLAQARLPGIGRKSEILVKPVSLDEVPLAILEKQTGFVFNEYAPLAGVRLRVLKTGKSENE